MRFFLVAAIWVLIVGGLWLYIWQRDAAVEKAAFADPVEAKIESLFSLEITPTFSIEEDPFALQTDTGSSPPIKLRLNGDEIVIPEVRFDRGQTMKIENVAGIVVGHNEIHLEASPPVAESMLDHGIRLRLLDQGVVLVDKTIWNSQGSLVSGAINFEITGTGEVDHEH